GPADWLGADPGSRATDAGQSWCTSLPATRAPCTSGWVNGINSTPTKLVQFRVINTKVMGDLMHDGDRHFLDNIFRGFADPQDRLPENRDPVRQHPGIDPPAFVKGI